MDMNNIIKSVVQELKEDFSKHPYDYTSYEIEAQVRAFKNWTAPLKL